MAGRSWTQREIRFLRRNIGRRSFPEIAEHLDRTVIACRQRALAIGMYVRHAYARYGGEFHAFFIKKHAIGWSDPEIAKAWGGERRAVGRHRRALGLRSNLYHARQNERRAATQFKKGCIRGAAARKWRAIGTVVARRRKACKGGRPRHSRWIKIKYTGPPKQRYVPLARYLWERKFGPIPTGFFVVHANGDTMDDRLSNYRLMDRKHLLAWQASVRPNMEAKRKKRCARANRQRWEDYRRIKALKAAG